MRVSNDFALKTATIGNAKIAGIDNVTGSVEVGKSADFLIVAENPLEDISALRRPETVVLRGKIYSKPKVKKFEYVENELDKHL